MPEHSRPAFGFHEPTIRVCRLIRTAQGCPHNWLGQQIAQIIRLVVLKIIAVPADIRVGAIRMRCRLGDNCSEQKFAFMPWRFDGRERQLLVEALPRDGVFVDIGANVGIYTLTAATHLGASGRIIALEPNPPALARLRFNIAATRAGRVEWPRIDALQVGVSDREQVADLHLSANNLGASTIVPMHQAADSSAVVQIRCRPLLAILAEMSVSRIHALKIDIEGAEDAALMPFLEHAPESLLPALLVVENSEHRWTLDLPGALAQRGYDVVMRSRMNTVYRRS